MACQFELLFNLQQYRNCAEVAFQVFDQLDHLENQLSIYRHHSEITSINETAGRHPVAIETGLFDLLQDAQQISEETNGAFDITAGPLSDVWGFSQRQGRIPQPMEIGQALQKVSWRMVKLDPPNHIQFLRPDIRINLGGIGKGYALDVSADWMVQNQINDFVFHGGQSSVLARGRDAATFLTNESPDGWVVGISHPVQPQCRLGELRLRDCALGTSGSARQGFFHRGRRYSHILDPRTGIPSDHVLSASVLCSSAAVADALSTAFFVMRLDEIQAYCDLHRDVKAAIVVNEPGRNRVGIESFNLNPDDWVGRG